MWGPTCATPAIIGGPDSWICLLGSVWMERASRAGQSPGVSRALPVPAGEARTGPSSQEQTEIT